jgi:hypothetical protein
MIPASLARVPLALAFVAFSATAWAQGPINLTPAPEQEDRLSAPSREQTGPLRLTPKRSAPPVLPRRETNRDTAPVESAAGSKAEASGYGVVQVQGLSEIDENSLGILSLEDGGFGIDMWQGTPRAVIERLLPQIPIAIRSAAMRDLAIRLLLSSAAMPAWPDGTPQQPGPSLIAQRISMLQSMGAFKDAGKLTAIAPQRSSDPVLLRLQAEDRLYANDYGRACEIVAGVGDHLARPYWQKLLVFCQTLQGNTADAALGASLLAETAGAEDQAFIALIDRLTKVASGPIDSLRNPNALHLAVTRTAKIEIPSDAIETAVPAIQRVIGVSPNARLETRLAAAEIAVELGALPAARLAEIYMAEKFEADELNNALSLAAADRSPRGRAVLFQSGQVETVHMARAAVISKALEIAIEEGRYLQVIDLYRTPLANLAAASQMQWFAAEAARALYALDRPLPARNWMAELRLAAARDPEAKRALDGLWYLALLTDSEVTSQDFEPHLFAWLDHHQSKFGAGWTKRAATGLRLLDALGFDVPDEAWWRVLDRTGEAIARPDNAALLTALTRAAAGGRRAETVMLALLAIGESANRNIDTESVATIVEALRRIGLEKEAKRLVLETAATKGL